MLIHYLIILHQLKSQVKFFVL